MRNNNQRGSNDLRGAFARAIRLLKYLRENTDKNHPITQTNLLRAGGEDHLFGAKKTLTKTIAALASASDIEGHRLLSYRSFDKYYGVCGDLDTESELDREDYTTEEEVAKILSDVTNIYYNHIFSEEELKSIINALHTSKAVDRAKAEKIIEKLLDNLAKASFRDDYKVTVL